MENQLSLQEAIDLARKGVSKRTIAAKAGIKLAELEALLDNDDQIRVLFEQATAEFELSRVQIKDDILFDETTEKSLRIKIVREDLKTLEQWATASKVVMQAEEPTGVRLTAPTYTELDEGEAARIREQTNKQGDI